MKDLQPKEYILKNWSTSSGKRITEMLKRYKPYFFTKSAPQKKEKDIVKVAEEIFNSENTDNLGA